MTDLLDSAVDGVINHGSVRREPGPTSIATGLMASRGARGNASQDGALDEAVDLVAHESAALDQLERKYGAARPIEQPPLTTSSAVYGVVAAFREGAIRLREGIRLKFGDAIGSDQMTQDALRKIERSNFTESLAQPAIESETGRGVYGGVVSLARNLPGLLATVIARSPTPALVSVGAQTEVEAYGKYRLRDTRPSKALLGAVGEGAVEVGTELMPTKFLASKFGRTGFGSFVGGMLAREIPGEQIATHSQDFIDFAMDGHNRHWRDMEAERPRIVAAMRNKGVPVTEEGIRRLFEAGQEQIAEFTRVVPPGERAAVLAAMSAAGIQSDPRMALQLYQHKRALWEAGLIGADRNPRMTPGAGERRKIQAEFERAGIPVDQDIDRLIDVYYKIYNGYLQKPLRNRE